MGEKIILSGEAMKKPGDWPGFSCKMAKKVSARRHAASGLV